MVRNLWRFHDADHRPRRTDGGVPPQRAGGWKSHTPRMIGRPNGECYSEPLEKNGTTTGEYLAKKANRAANEDLPRMNSVNEIISELAGIRAALRQLDDDPRQQPRRRTEPVRVDGDPTIDAGQWDVTNRDRWEEEKERTRRAVEGEGPSIDQSGNSRSGTEALAWYVSFHDNQRAWGIYIPLSSLALMDELYLGNLPIERERRFQLAWSALMLHEKMHFAVDYACAWFELMLRAPIRREFMDRFNSQPPLAAAMRSEAYLEVEETLANAYMLRELTRTSPRQIVRAVEEFVKKQPAGYRECLQNVQNIPSF